MQGLADTGEYRVVRRHGAGGAGQPFRAILRDGREIEVSPLVAGVPAPGARHGWTATAVARRQPGYLGLAWCAPVPSTAGHALAEVVVQPGLEGSGLGLLLFDTVVLAAVAAGVSSLTVFLPGHAEDFVPALAGLGGRVVSGGGPVLVAELPLGRGPRRYVGSGTHSVPPAA